VAIVELIDFPYIFYLAKYGHNIPEVNHPSAVISLSQSVYSEPKHMFDPKSGATFCARISVVDKAFIGACSVILSRIKISNSSIVGAGAVVTKNVLSGLTVIDNHAKFRS
jgi:acetyltransferase-like isoleucine patch superfamily enzyme